MKKINIGYFADGYWAHESFRLINNDDRFQIKFICVRYDSGDKVLEKLSSENDIDLLKHKNVNSSDFLDSLKKYNCDIFVSMSFNQILKKQFIEFPRLKTINCHAGKLPYYRGRNILNWVLINDEKDFGITVHYVDEGIDTGDIMLQKTLPITDEDNYNTLLNRSYVECANVLYECLIKIYNNDTFVFKQNTIHPVGFYCVQRKEGDELINWDSTSREIFNFVRAICIPGPMARTFCDGIEIKINKASLIPSAPDYKLIPGVIVGKSDNTITVKTRDTTILIEEFYSAKKLRIGDRLNQKELIGG